MADAAPTSDGCAKCKKLPEAGATAFQRCFRCRSCRYCSKDCQAADWTEHKKSCSSGTAKAAPKSTKSTTESLLSFDTKTWLHNKPEAEVFTLLIDSYRMRVEDEYVFRGDVSDDSLYGQGDPAVGFRKFLRKAETRDGVLPPWWNAGKRRECIVEGGDEDSWSCLHFAVEKHDVQEHYKNPMMPMLLRMLGEEIEGSNVTSLPGL